MAIATTETVVGTATSAASISATSWTPSANDLILVWVACRSGITVSSISGNGITFVKVAEDLQSPQNQCTLSVWRGMSASPTSGQITATLSGTANAAVIVAHRIAGADTSGTNGSGAIGASATANTGATDTNAPSVNITTTAVNSRVYGGATHRAQTYTTGSGETGISTNNSAGTAGDTTSCSTEYQDVATSGSTVTINGALGSATDWIQIAVEVKVLGVVFQTSTDSTTASDASSLAAAIPASDSAAASDASSLAVTLTKSDTGTASDASSLAVTLSSSDSATLSETATAQNIGTPVVGSDTPTLSETASIAATIGANDSAALSEASTVTPGARADLAALSEISSLVVAVFASDGAALSETALASLLIILYPSALLTVQVPPDMRTVAPTESLTVQVPADVRNVVP